MAEFYSFFDQILFFVCTGVKMLIFSQENDIYMLVVKNVEYFANKNMISLTDKVKIFLPAYDVLP